jgi:hypothetical protein
LLSLLSYLVVHVFVRDHRPSIGSWTHGAVKCVFVIYSFTQHGCKCWSPSAKCMFVSMDVTFRKSRPFFGEPTDPSLLFAELDHLHSVQDDHEGRRRCHILRVNPWALKLIIMCRFRSNQWWVQFRLALSPFLFKTGGQRIFKCSLDDSHMCS